LHISRLEENKILTDFQLKTEDIDQLMDFELEHVLLKVSLKPDHIFELLAEMDSNMVEILEIRSCNDETMRLAGEGVSGMMEVFIFKIEITLTLCTIITHNDHFFYSDGHSSKE